MSDEFLKQLRQASRKVKIAHVRFRPAPDLSAENARLRKELDEARAEVAALRAALEPFAEVTDEIDPLKYSALSDRTRAALSIAGEGDDRLCDCGRSFTHRTEWGCEQCSWPRGKPAGAGSEEEPPHV